MRFKIQNSQRDGYLFFSFSYGYTFIVHILNGLQHHIPLYAWTTHQRFTHGIMLFNEGAVCKNPTTLALCTYLHQ